MVSPNHASRNVGQIVEVAFLINMVTIMIDHFSSALLTNSLCIFLANWVSVSDFWKHTESSGMKPFL